MKQTNNEREALLDKLLAEYWDIAYSEGNSGLWHGKKAQSTLNDIRKLFKTQSPISQNEQQEAVAYTDGEGDFITKEMYDEYLKLGFYTECIVPLYNSPPKQIPDGWKSLSEKQIEDIALSNKFWFGPNDDRFDWLGFSGELSLKLQELNVAPTTILTSETNTEVWND